MKEDNQILFVSTSLATKLSSYLPQQPYDKFVYDFPCEFSETTFVFTLVTVIAAFLTRSLRKKSGQIRMVAVWRLFETRMPSVKHPYTFFPNVLPKLCLCRPISARLYSHLARERSSMNYLAGQGGIADHSDSRNSIAYHSRPSN